MVCAVPGTTAPVIHKFMAQRISSSLMEPLPSRSTILSGEASFKFPKPRGVEGPEQRAEYKFPAQGFESSLELQMLFASGTG
jgi:hypothetical protein